MLKELESKGDTFGEWIYFSEGSSNSSPLKEYDESTSKVYFRLNYPSMDCEGSNLLFSTFKGRT